MINVLVSELSKKTNCTSERTSNGGGQGIKKEQAACVQDPHLARGDDGQDLRVSVVQGTEGHGECMQTVADDRRVAQAVVEFPSHSKQG